MKFVRLGLKFATLASSITLFAGFVAFRAGALNEFVAWARGDSTVMSGSKSAVVVLGFPDDDSSEPASTVVMPGSKSTPLGFAIEKTGLPFPDADASETNEIASESQAKTAAPLPLVVVQNDEGIPIASVQNNEGNTTVMSGSKVIVGIVLPADLATQNTATTPAKSVAKDLTPLSQSSTFSQPPQEVVIGAIASTKSLVLDWIPPPRTDYLDGNPIFTNSHSQLVAVFGDLSQPSKPKSKEPTRTVMRNGRPVVISGSKSIIITGDAPNTVKRIDDYIDNHLAKQSDTKAVKKDWPPTFTSVLQQPPTVMPSSKAGVGFNFKSENVK